MRIGFLFACVGLLSAQAIGQSRWSIVPETVVVPSGNLRLKGFLWRPEGSAPAPAILLMDGSGSTDAGHPGELAITAAADGHMFVYTDIAERAADVFGFLGEHVRR